MKLTRWMMLLMMFCFAVFAVGCSSKDTENPNDPDDLTDRSGLYDSQLDIPGSDIPLDNGNPDGEGGAGAGEFITGAGDPADGDWVVVDVKLPTIYFAYDSNQLGSSETAKLDSVVKYLGENGLAIIIEGHCDDRGTVEYNRGLGERRALSVKEYMAGKGFSEDSVKTVSYGKDKPAVEGTSAEARSANRRAQLLAAQRR